MKSRLFSGFCILHTYIQHVSWWLFFTSFQIIPSQNPRIFLQDPVPKILGGKLLIPPGPGHQIVTIWSGHLSILYKIWHMRLSDDPRPTCSVEWSLKLNGTWELEIKQLTSNKVLTTLKRLRWSGFIAARYIDIYLYVELQDQWNNPYFFLKKS